MLEFFRAYQRIVFFVITIVVITSFVFFGTFSTFAGDVERPDRQVGQTIHGSAVMLSEVQKLARFIATDREDVAHLHGLPPNYCNDGVIRYDFLRPRLAELLVAEYFDALKGDLALRLDKAKRYRPYAHPDAPFLSAKAIWEHLLPPLNQQLAALQEEKEATPAVFAHLVKLYALQSQLQPETLRRILMYQHQQYPWLAIDQRLAYEDMALFGFHSVSDWFGHDFVDLVSQFIVNVAEVAERKGYQVSLEEAKGDLLHHFIETNEKLTQAKAKPETNFHQHLRLLGFDERSAAEVWRKVLLFRRYFQEIGEATFVDRLPFKDFAEYAQEAAVVVKYEWPVALHTAQDLANYTFYVKAVSPKKKGALPAAFLSVEEVEKKYPTLVQTTYRAKVAEITKKQVGLRASLKEIWAWQQKNWDQVSAELSLPERATREERFTFLQRLDPKKRAAIDDFVRDRLVEENPAWVEEALAALPLREKVWKVAGQENPSLRAEGTYARMEELEVVEPKHILPFKEAHEALTQLVGKVDGEMPKDKNPFLPLAQEALVALKKDPSDLNWVQKGENPLEDQFKFLKKEETLPRNLQGNSQENWMQEQAFMMLPDLWSPLHVADQGEIVFFYLQEKKAQPAPILEQLNFGKESLSADAKRYVAKRLLQKIKNKNAIVIPVQREDHGSI